LKTTTFRTQFIHFVIDRPWTTLFLCLVATVGFGTYLRDITPSVSYKDLLGADHPKLIEYEAIQSEFTRDENLLVLIEAKDGDAFDANTLGAVRSLTDLLWKTPYSIRVDSLSNFQHSEADGDTVHVYDLVGEGMALDPQRVSRIREIALSEPLLLNRAVNRAANVLGISVNFAFPNVEASEKIKAVDYVNQLTAQFEQKNPQLKTYVSGLIALDATVMQISQKETGMFLVIVISMVLVLLAALMRAVSPVVISIFVCVLSIVVGMALAGLMGWKLTPFTASVPLIILIVAVADCVHIVTAYLQRLRAGSEKREALCEALKSNLRPVAVTSLTTAVGFLTLNFSASDSINALGNEVAIGLVAAFVLSVTLLPAALRLLPMRVAVKQRVTLATRIAGRSARFIERYRIAVLIASLGSALGLGYCVQYNEFNDIIPRYFAESLPWRQANDFAEAQFGGAYTFTYSFGSGQSDGISEPKFLAQADRFTAWLRSLSEVVYVNSVTDTFKRLNRNMHGDDPVWYRLPEDRALAAQYLLLYEMSLPYGLDLNDQINLDKSAIRVQATFKTLSTKEILAMEDRIASWLKSNVPEIEVKGSGVQLMFAHMMIKDVRAMILGTTAGLAIISLLLIIAFRSVRIGLVSLLPNLVPALMAFGVWGIFFGQIGLGLAMVSGMTIGIIVDDTVHFLNKYLIARREKNYNPQQAVEYAFATVGPAIAFTTLVLIAGFLSMTFLADFRLNSDMGLMTSIVLVFALIFDLLALPAILMVLDRKQEPVIQITMVEEATG